MSAQKETLTLPKRLAPKGYSQITVGANLTGTITAATKANPAVITSAAHGLSTGQKVKITAVVGMVELNGITFTITRIDANSFSLDGINSTAYTTYVSDGTWTLEAMAVTVPDGATYALVQCETQNFRWRDDGTDPTASVGMLLVAAAAYQMLSVADLAALKFIPVAATCKLNVAFYGEAAPE